MHERWQQLLPRPHGNCLQAPCAGGARDCAHLHLAGSAGAAGAGCHAAAAAAPIAAARHSAACRCRGWHACHVRHARGHPPVDCNLPPPARRRLVTSASPALRRCLSSASRITMHRHRSRRRTIAAAIVVAALLLPYHCCRHTAAASQPVAERRYWRAPICTQPAPAGLRSSQSRAVRAAHMHAAPIGNTRMYSHMPRQWYLQTLQHSAPILARSMRTRTSCQQCTHSDADCVRECALPSAVHTKRES